MIDKIQKLRQLTGAGVLDCKKALEEANLNIEQAVEILRKAGIKVAQAKQDRQTGEGYIGSYVHSNGKVASLVELKCETDFVSRNQEFKDLARDLAMQITAMVPLYVSPQDVPEVIKDKEKEIASASLKLEGKPEAVMEKILAGKLNKFYEEVCLLKQKFIKEDKKTVEEIIMAKIQKLGEKIEIGRFSRLAL